MKTIEELKTEVGDRFDKFKSACSRRASAFGVVQALEARIQEANLNLQIAINSEVAAEREWREAYVSLKNSIEGDEH